MKQILERLHQLGISKTIMLTGDNERVGRAVAHVVGLDNDRDAEQKRWHSSERLNPKRAHRFGHACERKRAQACAAAID